MPAGLHAPGTQVLIRMRKSERLTLRVIPKVANIPEYRDIQTFYDWGFSYLKYDNCASENLFLLPWRFNRLTSQYGGF
jgi:hypothetical protein